MNPCEPSTEYNFARCVETKIMTEAGCQPPWRRFSVEGRPSCNNFTLLAKNFGATYRKYYIDITDREGIIAETGCLMPCSFMEYKVRGLID